MKDGAKETKNKSNANQDTLCILKTIHVEGLEIFYLKDIERVFLHLDRAFKSPPQYIDILDEQENPSNRMTEIDHGYWIGSHRYQLYENGNDIDEKYFIWDMPKDAIKDFVKYVNYDKPWKQCKEVLFKHKLLKEKVDEQEIEDVTQKVDWISATAKIDKSEDVLLVYIRIKLLPASSDSKTRKYKDVLEKAVEMYFHDLNGFSHDRYPCFYPSVPKVISLSVLCNNNFINLISDELETALTEGKFNITMEIRKILNILGDEVFGNLSVIKESEYTYQFIWQRTGNQYGQVFYFVDFTIQERLIIDRLKHSLPKNAPGIRGTTDLISDILSYVSYFFTYLKFYRYNRFELTKNRYSKVRGEFIRNFHTLTTKKYDKILLDLLEIETILQKYLSDLNEKRNELTDFDSFYLRLHSPEVAVSHSNIFEVLLFVDDKGYNQSLTLDQSLTDLNKRLSDQLNSDMSNLSEAVEKTIQLVSTRMQMKSAKMNAYLIAFTAILILVGLTGLFGFKI